jgi:hypothetical protein
MWGFLFIFVFIVMKIILTEKQVDNLLGGMLNNMFKDFEIKYVGDNRHITVGDKLIAILGPTKGEVSADIYHELKDNLFYSSDKDLKSDIANWIKSKFGSKIEGIVYGITFKKLHGEEKEVPKKERPKDPRGAEPGFDIQGFQARTGEIEKKIKDKRDLIRAAKNKVAPDTFEKWMKKEVKIDNERERRKQEKNKQEIENAIQLLKNLK